MNILMVTERYIPIWGGAENQLRQLIPHLIDRGCAVRVVTRRWHRTLPTMECIDKTEVFRLGVPGTGILATGVFVVALVLFMFRHRKWIDILHSHGAVNLGALCRGTACFLGKKNVAKIASAGRIPPLYGKALGRMLLYFFKQSDAIVSMTDEIDRELQAIGVDNRKVRRLVNGVDGNRFYPSAEGVREKVREELGIAGDCPIVLFSSRLVADKGLRVLLEAWPLILARHANAWLVVLGSGALQKNSIEEEAKRHVKAEKLSNIKFMGETTQPEVFLGVADVFVFPSRREGFPNALMEALVAAVPVVASDIGGVTGIIVDNRVGILFQAGNADELAGKVVALLDDPGAAKERAVFSRKYMIENYSFALIASGYYSLYQELSGDAPHRQSCVKAAVGKQ